MKSKSETKRPTNATKLIRSGSDRVIAGVCGGLGDFFQVDATIIRLIFVLVTIFGGGGVLLYLILWLIIPSQGSSSEITRENIEKGVDEIKDKALDLTKSMKLDSVSGNSKQLLGIVIVILGVILLLGNFGLFDIVRLWKYMPAILIILLGVLILRKHE